MLAKSGVGWPILCAVSAERVALLPARSACPDSVGDLVGGLPFAILFVFMDLTRAPYRRLFSLRFLVSDFRFLVSSF